MSTDLGFATIADVVFRDLVLAPVLEPTSLLDNRRMLKELRQDTASYATMKRTPTRSTSSILTTAPTFIVRDRSIFSC